MLDFIEDTGVPCGVEVNAFSLMKLYELNPAWVAKFRQLVQEGKVELIGSGFVQSIGPLQPAALVKANLVHGSLLYREYLGVVPEIALINEQAYSSGLISIYRNAGYRALIMEWNNAASVNPAWGRELRYHPQIAIDSDGNEIFIIWSDSILFQQFQRLAHGEINKSDYEEFLYKHIGSQAGSLCLYSNDVEVFGFRPGRFTTEPDLCETGVEWRRIGDAVDALREKNEYEFVLPGQTLDAQHESAFHRLSLCNSVLPIPVKKQGKYNILRWANSGRNDLEINTRCWRIYRQIEHYPIEHSYWRRLCALWASDFRTHITDTRWQGYIDELTAFEDELGIVDALAKPFSKNINPIDINERFLKLESPSARIVLDTRRGLTIRSCELGDSKLSLFGLIPHGYFHDIRYAADWFSGHMTYESGGRHKITDLSQVSLPSLAAATQQSAYLSIADFGEIRKQISIQEREPAFTIDYAINGKPDHDGLWRCAYFTFNPEAFDQQTLFYATHNGGETLERFEIDREFDHGRPVSHLVSANTGLGATKGIVIVGDEKTQLEFRIDQAQLAVIPMLSFHYVDDSYLLRLWFSLRELDDTRRFDPQQALNYQFTIQVRLLDSPHLR